MKTLIITAAIMFAVGSINAQTNQELATQKNIKKIEKKEARLKSEKKRDRITLRKLEGSDASYQSKQQFAVDFPKVTDAQWKRNGYLDEATFDKDGKPTHAFYSINDGSEAELVGTTSPVEFSALPTEAQKRISKEYKNYKIDGVIFYDDNEHNDSDMMLYGAQFEDEDSYFVELSNSNSKIILHVTTDGNVFFFTDRN